MLRKMPFYGVILNKIDFILDDSIEKIATDGRKIIVNPAYIESLTPGTRHFAIMHETFHLLLGHCRTTEEPVLWNVAADLVADARAAELLPDMYIWAIAFENPQGLFENVHPGFTAEDLYRGLREDNTDHPTETVLVRKFPGAPKNGENPLVPMTVVPDLSIAPENTDAFLRAIVTEAKAAIAGKPVNYYIPPEILAIGGAL